MLIQSFIYPSFTTLDLIGALQPLAFLPDAKVEIIARETGIVPTDCGASIVATHSYETASKTPDVLLVPGGGTPSVDILEDEEAIGFLAKQGEQAGWIVSVCTGALLLGQAGLLRGYRAASHWGVIDTLDAFGAEPVQSRVVVDRNRCTGGGVTAGIDIGLSVAALIADEQLAKALELALEYNPKPPFGTGHPTIADPTTLVIATTMAKDAMDTARIRKIARRAL
jgi:cyclohexyl-isocyanide hydratase